jgi:hypothetical protein
MEHYIYYTSGTNNNEKYNAIEICCILHLLTSDELKKVRPDVRRLKLFITIESICVKRDVVYELA